MSTFRAATVVFGLVALAGCGSNPRQTASTTSAAPDTTAIAAALSAIWQQLGKAEETGDANLFIGVFAENARIDGQGGSPLIGHTAIADKARQSFGARKYHVMDMKPHGTRVWSGTAAHQYGTLREVHTPHGEKTRTEYGRWASELVRGADGRWRINHLIAFLDSTKVASE